METPLQRYLRKNTLPEPSHYEPSGDGITEIFTGLQVNLWDFFARGILPYKKSTTNSEWVLVGHGLPYSSCGEIIGRKCDNRSQHEGGKVFRRYHKNNCHRRECPVCYESWGSTEAERALIRLVSYVEGVNQVHRAIENIIHETFGQPSSEVHKKIVAYLDKFVKKAVHIVVSLPPDRAPLTKFSYPKARRKLLVLLKRAGIRGGLTLFHEKRYHCSQCNSPIPDYHKICPECGCNEFVWVDNSPHFHVLSFGWVHSTKEIYDKSGWLIKNLGLRKSVYATLQYCLSHATYFQSKDFSDRTCFHICTWFGELSYNQLGAIPKLKRIIELCPYCGGPLYLMEEEEVKRYPPPREFDNYLDVFT